MADNVAVTPGSGNIVAADEVVDGILGTVKVQYVKIMDGTLDGTSKAAVGANGLKVDGSAVTQPVSAAALPLPSGAATSANQTTELASLASIDSKTPVLVGGRQPVDGSAVTQPVSGTVTINPLTNTSVVKAQLFDSAGRETSMQSKLTYMASAIFTPAATPSDLVIVEGSATKTIRIISFIIGTTNTAAGSQQFFLIKRSAADTTGTFVAATKVPLDSANAASTANRVGHFTANPGALGAAVGTIATNRVASPAAVPASFAGITPSASIDLLALAQNSLLDQPVTLRGVAETLALNFNGAALVAGQTHFYTITWIEE